jgi:2'-5' RNA ligase
MKRRLFIGIPVSASVDEHIQPVRHDLKETGADLSFTSQEHTHITVKFLGDVDDNDIEDIKRTIGAIASPQRKISFSLKGIGVFPNSDYIRVIWVGIDRGKEEIIHLMKQCNRALANIREEQREEHPHLTIARMRTAKHKENVRTVVEKYAHTSFGDYNADNMVLYESTLTRTGSLYTPLAEFPFTR